MTPAVQFWVYAVGGFLLLNVVAAWVFILHYSRVERENAHLRRAVAIYEGTINAFDEILSGQKREFARDVGRDAAREALESVRGRIVSVPILSLPDPAQDAPHIASPERLTFLFADHSRLVLEIGTSGFIPTFTEEVQRFG